MGRAPVTMRMLVIANSQGTDTGVAAGESYPEVARSLLADHVEIVSLVESGWTIAEFVADSARIVDSQPDVVFCQLGIVECACRILSAREKKVLARIRGSSRLTKLLHDHRQEVIIWRRRLGISTRVMSPNSYRSYGLELARKLEAAGATLVFLEIPRFTPGYETTHFPFVNSDIDLFNGVMRELGSVPLIEPGDESDEIWQTGTVHLNRAGHELAARRLCERIEARVRSVDAAGGVAARGV